MSEGPAVLTGFSPLVTPMMELKPNAGSDRAWVWNTHADFADECPKPELLAIRFLNAESKQNLPNCGSAAFLGKLTLTQSMQSLLCEILGVYINSCCIQLTPVRSVKQTHPGVSSCYCFCLVSGSSRLGHWCPLLILRHLLQQRLQKFASPD